MNAEPTMDTEQVLELMLNGFTREGACSAVAESHGHQPWGEYANQLMTHPDVVNAPSMTRNANGSWYCHDCKCIVILFDDDEHDDCPNDGGIAKYERQAQQENRSR